MTQPLTFQEWKEKNSISPSNIARDLMDHGWSEEESEEFIDEMLKDEYKFYQYQVKNPNWYEVLKDENSKYPKVRDDWESIVDAENTSQVR